MALALNEFKPAQKSKGARKHEVNMLAFDEAFVPLFSVSAHAPLTT